MINFGGLQGGEFQNALSMGMQMGQMARQRQDQKEYKNALAQFDPSNPDTLKPVMAANPEVGLQLRGQMQNQQAAAQEGDLVQRAMAGDAEAMGQLATVNFDKWKTLDTNTKAIAKQEAEVFGNAALDLLNTPPEQRGAKLQGYVQQMGQQYPEVAQIAQLPPQQLEAALRSAVFEAQMVDKLIALERPDYQVLPEGGTLVDTRNPAAVAQFGGQAPQQAPRQQAPQILPRTARPQGLTDDQLFQQAREAVDKGANVDTVFRQLREWGVEVN